MRMLNGSFAQLVLFAVRTMQRISSWFISAKFMRGKPGKSGINWLFDVGKFLNISLKPLTFSRKYLLNSFAN